MKFRHGSKSRYRMPTRPLNFQLGYRYRYRFRRYGPIYYLKGLKKLQKKYRKILKNEINKMDQLDKNNNII